MPAIDLRDLVHFLMQSSLPECRANSACRRLASATVLACAALACCVAAYAQPVLSQDNNTGATIAVLEAKHGEVSARWRKASAFEPVDVGADFREEDSVRTGRLCRAAVKFNSGVLLRMAPTTTILFKSKPGATGVQPLNIESGIAYFFSREPTSFPVIDTPAVTTAVRGTEFVVEVSGDETVITVLEGQVESKNSHGQALASRGERISARPGEAPRKTLLVKPRDAVQWALYYPPVIDRDFFTLADDNSIIQEALSLFDQGRTEAAASLLNSKGRSAASKAALAQIYLSSGDTFGAQNAIDSAQSAARLTPRLHASLLAQQAVIALVKDDKQSAGTLVTRALEMDPAAPAALLAKSYYEQSSFDLEAARLSANALAENTSRSSFALIRLAELELSFGNVDQALSLLNEANVRDEYGFTILGFVQLFRGENDPAQSAFEKALALQPGYALARLGFGLLLIKQGELALGREQLERAAAFDPNTAIYRSYLGKAYFEEEREALAGKEYDTAIALDPRDPTPYLYRAFNQLSQNRVVEALKDTEYSIELNNNRAVYRSSLLLDQDHAVRSAGLAEVFSALGFEQAARVEAIKAINRDYGNYSAHRFLADSYKTIRLSDSSVSERGIASLLGPVSANLLRGSSARSSLNEYNALFDREEHRAEVRGLASSYDDLLAPGAALSGKIDKLSYAFDYSAAFYGGSRHNNYQYLQRGDGITQYELDHATKLSLEASTVFEDFRELETDIDEGDTDQYSFAIGALHQFNPNWKILAQSSFNNERRSSLDFFGSQFLILDQVSNGEIFSDELDLLIDQFSRDRFRGSRNSIQTIYDSDLVSLVLGAQFLSSDVEREEDSIIIDDSFGAFPGINYRLRSFGYNDLFSYSIYNYNTFHLSEYADLTAGLNYSALQLEYSDIAPYISQDFSRSRLSPKVGLTLYPLESTTVRAAYFENLRKSSFEDNSTLEPTLVGGINQLITDLPGSRSRNYGLGIDHKVRASTYLGIEGLHRDLIEQSNAVGTLLELDFDGGSQNIFHEAASEFESHRNEDSLRAYLYQVLNNQFVATLDYDLIYGETTDPDIYQEITTHRVAPAIRFFSETGLFAFLRAAWWQQDRSGSDFFEDGVEDFWIVDLGIGARLPNRHGAVLLTLNNVLDQSFEYDDFRGFGESVPPEFGAYLEFRLSF